MSAFKRHQSKVFWDQMSAQDLKNDPFLRQRDPATLLEFPPPPPLPEDEERLLDQEESSSLNENNVTHSENVTVIHVCQRSKQSLAEEKRETGVAGHCTSLENRSFSPLSQDLRSQDSGFSDSERSNCSEIYEKESAVRRKRRQRKTKDRNRRIHEKIDSLWLEGGAASSSRPTCTSTPKDRRFRDVGVLASPDCRIQEEDASQLERSESKLEISPISLASTSFEENSSNSLETKIIAKVAGIDAPLSVRTWLNDLFFDTANECCATLQNKSLPKIKRNEVISEEDQMKDLKTLSSLATAAASQLLVRADQFDRHYRYIYEKVSHLEGGRSEMELLRAIEEDACSVLSKLGAPPPRRIQQSNLRGILAQLERMKHYVDDAIDTRMDFYVEKIVRGLEEAPKEDSYVARGAVAALTALGLAGARAGNSIARCSGIRALLTSLVSASRKSGDYVVTSLRALSCVCCSSYAIDCFIKEGGAEIVTDLLSDETCSEKEKMEATALVVQITAPWSDAVGLPYLEPFARHLIPALSRLVEIAKSDQTLLLTAAAFNQMSKSRLCAEIIMKHDVVRKLLRSVKKSSSRNVWLMEQVAALVGELARTPEARRHLAKARASVALICFLKMRPPGLEDVYRRLEMTAAAALTRLCVDPEIAAQVVTVGGADCLPTYNVNDLFTEDEEQVEAGLLKYTKSLRRACKKAAKEIDAARAHDYSAFS